MMTTNLGDLTLIQTSTNQTSLNTIITGMPMGTITNTIVTWFLTIGQYECRS